MGRGDGGRRGVKMTRRTVIACLLSLIVPGCVYNPAPAGWLPTPAEAPDDAHGAWIVLTLGNDSSIAGEFLAYERDTVWLLRQDGRVRAEAVAPLKTAQVMWYDSQLGNVGLITLAGAASTFSNGVFLVLTMPIWIIAGTATAASDSKVPAVNPARTGWEAANIYARYPAGLPSNLPERLPLKVPPPTR